MTCRLTLSLLLVPPVQTLMSSVGSMSVAAFWLTLSLLRIPPARALPTAAASVIKCENTVEIGDQDIVIYWRATGRVRLMATEENRQSKTLTWNSKWRSQSGSTFSKTALNKYPNKYLDRWVNDSNTTSSIFWYEYSGCQRSGKVQIRAGAPPTISYSHEGHTNTTVSNASKICVAVTGNPVPKLSVSCNSQKRGRVQRSNTGSICLQVTYCKNLTATATNCLGTVVTTIPVLVTTDITTLNIQGKGTKPISQPVFSQSTQTASYFTPNPTAHSQLTSDSESGIAWWIPIVPVVISLLAAAVVAVIVATMKKTAASTHWRNTLHMYEDIANISSRSEESAVNCYQVSPYAVTPGQVIIDRLSTENPYLEPLQYTTHNTVTGDVADQEAAEEELDIVDTQEATIQQTEILTTYV